MTILHNEDHLQKLWSAKEIGISINISLAGWSRTEEEVSGGAEDKVVDD